MSVAIAIKDGGDLDIDAPGLRLLDVPALLIYSLIINYNMLIFQSTFFCSNYKIILWPWKEGRWHNIMNNNILASYSLFIYVAYGLNHAPKDHLCTHEH